MPFPGIDDVAEVRRLHVAIRAIWWNGDPRLGAARPDMTDRIKPTGIVQFPETDFAAIARGYGAQAATVRTLADLDPVRAWVEDGAPGVFVIDAKINTDLEADWHAEHFP